jgi:hypothetical protein
MKKLRDDPAWRAFKRAEREAGYVPYQPSELWIGTIEAELYDSEAAYMDADDLARWEWEDRQRD